ncbi:MAG: ATP-dependent endonuclease [Planctomycetia bacterium]|nr:ATP-dependent endonuclease [Planctomycetia bacterium]
MILESVEPAPDDRSHPGHEVVGCPRSLLRRTVRLIVVVEGGNDIRFLKRISLILNAADPELPDLKALEHAGQLLFLPMGGSNVRYWTERLAGLGVPELHLYDHESVPEYYERQALAALVNLRPACRAFVSSKRSLENYLDRQAIREARGIDVEFGDHDDVAQIVAARFLESRGGPELPRLPSRARRRLIGSVKGWLNTEAVDRMTAQRLASRDPTGEVRMWMKAILKATSC